MHTQKFIIQEKIMVDEINSVEKFTKDILIHNLFKTSIALQKIHFKQNS